MDLYQREGRGAGTGIDVNGSLPKRGKGDWYRCEWIFTKGGGGGGVTGIDVDGSLPKREGGGTDIDANGSLPKRGRGKGEGGDWYRCE